MKTALPTLAFAFGMLCVFSSLAWMHGDEFDYCSRCPALPPQFVLRMIVAIACASPPSGAKETGRF